jgi:hypothetical protein
MEDHRESKRALQVIPASGRRGKQRKRRTRKMRKTGVKRCRIKVMDRTEW